MWNSYWNGKSRRELPRVNYNESSEEEENFDSPLVSPERPPVSRAGSPQPLAIPTLGDNVDEELEAVSQTLRNVGHTHTFRGTHPHTPGDRPDPEGIGEEEVLEINVVGAGDNLKDGADNEDEDGANNMPNNDIIPFDTEDGVDEAGAMREACARVEKIEWDMTDLLFVFTQLETKMASSGVKKQFTKFQVVSGVLPKRILDQVKSMVRRNEAEFPNKDAYKLLKKEILKIFGPKPEAAIERGLSRVLTSTPSELARQLVNDLCKHELTCDCCPAFISTLWKRQLPGNVRAGIAHITFSKDTFDAIVTLADDIFLSTKASGSVAAIQTSAASVPLDETLPAIPYATQEVNAVSRGRGGRGGRGRGGRNNRGNGRGGQNGGGQNNQQSGGASGGQNPKHKGTKHPDLPAGDWQGCSMHFRWGRSAFFCSEPGTCPWKNVFKQK